MKKIRTLMILFCATVAIASAQQRQSLAVLPSVAEKNALDPQRLVLLTDKVRELAAKNLPINDFILLKQDAIVNRIGEEELFRACKEGVCVAELTERVSANYGARCDIVKLDSSLVLKFELYSVNEKAILETFTKYDVKDFREMLDLLEARLPDAFIKMANAPKAPRGGYTVIFNANGGNGLTPVPLTVDTGSAIILPNQGDLTKDGYNFDGWNTDNSGVGANYSAGSSYTPTGSVTLYAKWNAPAVSQTNIEPVEPEPLPEPPPEPRRTSWKSGMSVGGGGFFAADIDGGIAWGSGEYMAMPYTVSGAYLFFDAGYAYASIGYSIGGGKWESATAPDLPYAHRTNVNIGVFAKYPLFAGRVTYYPVLGLDWVASTYGRLAYDDGTEYVFDATGKRPAASALSAFWVRFGGGVDFKLGQTMFLRAELLYGVRTASEFEKNKAADSNGETRQGHGPTVKIGIGINMD